MLAAVGCADEIDPQRQLIPAVLKDDKDMVERLLNASADVNINWNAGGSVCPALCSAAALGNETMVRLLLERGAKPDVAGGAGRPTPLISAAYRGHLSVVKLLVAAGANPDIRTERVGHTALIEAAWKGHKEVVLVLLGAGANPLIMSSNGSTAADYARRYGHKDIEMLLVGAMEDRFDQTKRDPIVLK